MTPTILYLGSQSLYKTLLKTFPETVFISSFSALSKNIDRQYPHMIFFEDTDPDTSIHNTSRLRTHYPEVQIPVVIWGTQTWLPHQKVSLSALGKSFRLSPSLSVQRMKDQIELLLDMTYFDREEGEFHPHALGLLIRAFREEKNGFLFNPYRNIPLRDGGVITVDAEEQLQHFLYEEAPQFEEREEKGLGDWLLIMDILWKTLKQQTSPGFLSKRKNLRISLRSQYNRLFSLPLSQKTLEVLFETDPKDTISTKLAQKNLPQSSIEQELEILYMMGFCSFTLPSAKTFSLPKIKQTEVRNEEEGWMKIPLLKSEQNIILDKASPHFWRTLLDKQQNIQASVQNDVLMLLKANRYLDALKKLQSTLDPSWEELQLICWTSINILPTQNRMEERLLWLHEQSPTISSSLILCTLFSEQNRFIKAQEFLQSAQKISGATSLLEPVKQKIQAQIPIPRSLAHSLIIQSYSQKTNAH